MILNLLSIFEAGDKISTESLLKNILESAVLRDQASLSMEFSRQEYRSGLPFPSPGDLPDPGIKPMSPALPEKFFTLSH